MPTVSKIFEIHYYEIDIKKRARISKLMNFFYDTAIFQSEKACLDLDTLEGRNLTWVLYQWDIKILDYPVYRDLIEVKTTPTGFNGFYAYRKYNIFNSSGKEISKAESVWFLIDTVKKRPTKVPSDMYEAYGITSEESEFFDIIKIKPPERQDSSYEFTVKYNDIDTNGHVNNTRYIDWALDLLPLDFFQDYTLKNLKVTYKKEAKEGERILAAAQIDNNGSSLRTVHKLTDIDGNILCLNENEWRHEKDLKL